MSIMDDMAPETTEVSEKEAEQIFGTLPSPPRGGNLPATAGSMQVMVRDSIITAQKVAVARDEEVLLRKIATLAARAGERWYYRYPVRDGNRTKHIEGPSIKCANEVARLFGNCQVDVRARDEGQTWMFYARFVDYETGFSMTRAFEQDKDQAALDSKNKGRLQMISFQIGQSKAIRNVICNALELYTNFAFEEAKKNMVETVGKKIDHYRAKVKERLGEMKIDLKRVEAVRGRAVDKWTAPDVAQAIAELQSIMDGMTTAADLYPAQGERPTRGDFNGNGKPAGNGQPKQEQASSGQQKPRQAEEMPKQEQPTDHNPDTGGAAAATEPETAAEPSTEDPAVPFDDESAGGDAEREQRDWIEGYYAQMSQVFQGCTGQEQVAAAWGQCKPELAKRGVHEGHADFGKFQALYSQALGRVSGKQGRK